MSGIVRGAILAAGEGRRLRRDGYPMAKPMVPIGGTPLVEHAIRNLAAAGVGEIAIIFNEEEHACAAWVGARFPSLAPRILVRTTPSSLQSFREVSRLLGPGPALVSTVDAFCHPADFVSFARAAARLPADATSLAVTRFVDDERPLWICREPEGRVLSIGGVSGDAVTAGFYVFSERARALAGPPPELDRLRDFLAWLLARGEPIHALDAGVVVDVDRARDVEAAEALASRLAPSAESR